MYCAALVEIVSLDSGVFDNLHHRRFPWLLVVLDSISNQPRSIEGAAVCTHESAILRFRPPSIALFKCVKNSVLNTQLIKGSGSCGELTPKESQSSLSVDVPTNLMAPRGIVRSDEMESCRFTMVDTTIYTALLVLNHISSVN